MLTALLCQACLCRTRQHAQPTRESLSTIESSCTFLRECAEMRDWKTFYQALHPDIQELISCSKFTRGIRLHGKFTRLIRQADYKESRIDGELGTAIVLHKGFEYAIAFKRDATGWKLYMDGEDLDALEASLEANAAAP